MVHSTIKQTGRRVFLKGATAATAGAAAAAYVTPELRSLGIGVAYAASATTGSGHGFTPGFWLNNGSGVGLTYWDQGPTPQDPDWGTHGGVAQQPFATTTPFLAPFPPPTYTGLQFVGVVAVAGNPYNGIASATTMADMLQVGSSNGSDDVQKAARQVITSVLNSAFLGAPPYTYTVAQVVGMWNALASNPNATFTDYKNLQDTLSAINSV